METDVEPYVCISEDCNQPPQFFADFELWARHMRERHSTKWTRLVHKPVVWRCDVDHEEEEFLHEDSFEKHLDLQHSDYSTAERGAIATSSATFVKRPPNTCPLCGYVFTAQLNLAGHEIQGKSVSSVPQTSDADRFVELTKHIAGHLRCLAFQTLDYLDDDEESVSEASTKTSGGKIRSGSRIRPLSGIKDLQDISLEFSEDELTRLALSAYDVLDPDWSTYNAALLPAKVRQDRDMIPDDRISLQFASAPPEFYEDWEDIGHLDKFPIEEDSILLTMMAYSLWDRAYDNFRKEDPQLVEKYERLLSSALAEAKGSLDETNNRIDNANLQERRAQLDIIIKRSLELVDEEIKYQTAGHEFVLQYQIAQAVALVQQLKDFVSEAVKAFPEASSAWAGVCLILPILTNPSVAQQVNRDGFTYVTAHMRYYAAIEPLLWPKNQDQIVLDPKNLIECEAHILGLYQHILDFQFRSVLGILGQTLIPHEDWKRKLSKVKDLECTVDKKFKEIYLPASRQVVEILGEHAKRLVDIIQNLLSAGEQQLQVQKGLPQDNEDMECIKDLRLTDPRDDKKRIEETKGGLLEDSYHWILEHSDFQQWRNGQQSPLLWIKGDPGKGKTMLLCGIINELEKSMAKTDLLSYFFCQATDSRINNATAVIRGLIYLIVDQQPSLISHIRKKYDHTGKTLFEDANAWVTQSEIFTNILQDPSLNSTYLIIDALDECVAGLPKLLDFIVRQSAVSPSVKWIVSSRNWPSIERRLERAGHKVRLCLELNAESVSTAVNTYIQHKVLQLAQRKKYDDKTRDAVLHHLSSNANETFLWVACVCQNLEMISRRNTLAKLNAFPPGLHSQYERMMEEICNSDDASLCKRILALIATVYQPITLKELTCLVEMLEDLSDDLEPIMEIVGLCGSFLTVRKDTIYFVHQSAKDYLLANTFDEIFPSGKDEAHYVIYSRSLQAMSRTLRRDMYSLRALGYPIERVELPDPDPLAALRYSCIYWVDHLCDWNASPRANHRVDLQDGGAIDKFVRKTYLYWLEALSLCRRMSDGVVSIQKLEALIQVILTPEVLSIYGLC